MYILVGEDILILTSILALTVSMSAQIMGASGSGKTSLLRAIGGLWRSGSGSIKRYVKYREIVGDGDRTGKDVSTLNAGEVGNSAMYPPPQVMILQSFSEV